MGISDNKILNKDEILLCSSCFKDNGLKKEAQKIGIKNKSFCPNCNSIVGSKLTRKMVRDLCYIFFVRGTLHKCEYGGAPIIQFNEHHYKKSDVNVSSWLVDDVKLIEQAGKVGLFYYGPRFWMLGEIDPLKSLQDEKERSKIIDKILSLYPKQEITQKDFFYRVRKNPKTPHETSEYDSPPDQFLGSGRFDKEDSPILYGSSDLELCLHECRTTVEDDLYVARLVPKQNLNLLNLSALINENVTEFESLDLAVHFLFLAGEHSYEICRDIATALKTKGFDGIIYPSYFSYIRTGQIPFETAYGLSIRKIPELEGYAESQTIPNIALFGRPIKEEKVLIECINKVVLNRVQYDISFGPAYYGV